MQDERMFEILDAAVREFIGTGEPVSSNLLFGKYDFGIRPAMIRSELSRLTDEGYLEQPYHSAGRVPSNKGYEFFAERVLQSRRPQTLHADLTEHLLSGNLARFLSALSGELGIAAAAGTERGEVLKEGLEPLMENLSWGPREEMLQVIKDFDALEKRMEELHDRMAQDFLDVFIGRKSPVTKSDELAVVAGDCEVGNGRIVIFAIGPKRMNYDKATSIFKGLKKISKKKK